MSDLAIFYIYIVGILAALVLAFVLVCLFEATKAKLQGGEFIETVLYCWNNY